MTYNTHKIGIFKKAIFLALVCITANIAFAEVVIEEVQTSPTHDDSTNPMVASGKIRILGKGFGTTPTVTLGQFGELEIDSADGTVIVAFLPEDIVSGQYLLLVTGQPTVSRKDVCIDEKPKALTFQYTGMNCELNPLNDQEGKFHCDGDPAGAGPIKVIVTKDASKVTVEPDDETIDVDKFFSLISKDGRFGSETKLEIRQGSNLLQSLNIHTSCSKDLFVGDIFGSITLIGSGDDVITDQYDEFDMIYIKQAFCGNGVKEADEECDDGDDNGGDFCTLECTEPS